MNSNDKKGPYSLHGLAKVNDVEGMIRLLGSRENLNAKDKLKRTPLHLACYFGSIDACRLLIENGADVNSLSGDDVRPLSFAVMKDQLEIVKILLANGALSGINATFQKNRITCLHLAAKNNNLEMVKLLLEKGSNPNVRSRDQKLAIEETTDEQIQKLIQEYTKKWNEEKKLKVQMRRKRRREKNGNAEEDDTPQDEPSKVEEEKKESEEKPSVAAPPPSKKLDLKKLAFMLNDDEDE